MPDPYEELIKVREEIAQAVEIGDLRRLNILLGDVRKLEIKVREQRGHTGDEQ